MTVTTQPNNEEEVLEGEIVEDKRRPGRPTKLTDKTVATLCKHLAAGLPMSVAAPLADVHPVTVERWLRQFEAEGFDDDSEDAQLLMKILKAKAKHRKEIIEKWIELAKETKQWAGLATYLERTDPDNFKRPSEKTKANDNVIGVLEVRLHEMERKQKPELGYQGS